MRCWCTKQACAGYTPTPIAPFQLCTDAPIPAGVQARLRSKQHLLDTLVDRARDVNAFTRARVLQTWAHLAERKVIPLGHWICVTGIAVGEWHSQGSARADCLA